MIRNFSSMLSVAALAVALFVLLTAPAQAGDPRYPFTGSNSFGTGVYAPSYYGYPLDEMSAGYYGGGRYNQYYSYGRGWAGSLADYPGPLVGRGVPPDYRGPMTRHGSIGHPAHDDAHVAASPLLQGDKVALITVEVPADAEVWIEGQQTKQTGASRQFVSPPIDKGRDYEYRIRARWKEDGKVVEQTKQITVFAGDNFTVGFPTGDKKTVVDAPKLFPLGGEN
jgi:uncharacterized protein (TIGR03000 family)